MTRTVLPDDIFSELRKYEERIARLENALRVVPHYIGQAGEPAFAGAWVNFDAGISFATSPPTGRPAGFYRHAGHVYLFGVIKSGVSGTTAFTLPGGFRPLAATGQNRGFPVLASGGMAQLIVAADGTVVPANVGAAVVATYCFLDGVVFRHA